MLRRRGSAFVPLPPVVPALLALVLALVGAHDASAQAFSPASRLDTYALGSPNGLAIGDLNDDGLPDLVTANRLVATVSVFLGTAGGRLDTPIGFTTGANPFAVALGDLDGDGHLDLAVANDAGSSVSLLLGTGTGTFGPKHDLATGASPQAVALADLDGDGHLDVVTANGNAGTVSVFLNHGDGSMGARTDYAAGASPSAVAIADVDADGRVDLVSTAASGGIVSVRLGSGGGAFGPRTDFTCGSTPLAVVATDLDGDGDVDLATANSGSDDVSVLLGNGAGVFAAHVDYAAMTGTHSIAAGDMNADGNADLVVCNWGAFTVSVLQGIGNGTFGTRTDVASGNYPLNVAVADFNLDGRLDIASVQYQSQTASVYLAVGAGTLGDRVDVTGIAEQRGVAIGDLDEDGDADLVLADYAMHMMLPRLSNGANGFSLATSCPLVFGAQPAGAVIADLDADGHLDVALAASGTKQISVFPGHGDGTFAARVDVSVGARPSAIACADLDRDGALDLVTANADSASVTVRYGDGAGGFPRRADFTVGAGPVAVAIGDVDRNGALDVLTANRDGGSISVLAGSYGGGFNAHVDYPAGTSTRGVAAADLTGDGVDDMAAVEAGSGAVMVWTNLGWGTFSARADYASTNTTPTSLVAADMNLDGRTDLVTTEGASPGAVTVHFNGGSGAFTQHTGYASGYLGSSAVAVGDMNADGRPDLAVANFGLGSGSAFFARGSSMATLAVTPEPSLTGAPVTLTAVVAPAPGLSGTATGVVRFFDGTTLLGSATLASGLATFPMWGGTAGTHTYTAVYAGDSRRLARIAAPLAHRIVASWAPAITSARDVPNDQGGVVKLCWNAAVLDNALDDAVTSYQLFRSVPSAVMARALAAGARLATSPGEVAAASGRVFVTTTFGATTIAWEYVGASGAYHLAAYSAVVTTLGDSSASGNPRTLFMVRALGTLERTWDSAPDSGYSVDNLPPTVPTLVASHYAAGTTTLQWNPNADADLAGYRLYRGANPAFVPGAGNRIATLADHAYADAAGQPYAYKLSAIDVHGNESGWVTIVPTGTTDVEAGAATAFALERVRPNPATGGAIGVQFALPSAAGATLEMLDVGGRRVAHRDLAAFGAGRHTLTLDGASLPPGVYLVRLRQGGAVACARLVVMR